MLVEDIAVDKRDGLSLLTGSVTRERDGLVRRAEYRFHDFPPELVSDRGDAFVAALLVPAMRDGEDLTIEAPVSPLLLNRVQEITETFATWRPRFRRINVAAPAATSERAGSAVGLFFSGGVDSYYSLLKNMEQHPTGDPAITHLIFGLGIDTIYGYDQRYINRVVPMIREIAGETGKQAIVFETNVRSDFARPDWTMHQGSALIAAGLALSPLLRTCSIASGRPRDELRPWGSHPHIDPLWSTETLEIVHDGLEAYRTRKIASHIAGSELALRTLRVCIEVEQQPKNCGRCSECLRTMVALHAAGVLHRCATFPQSLDMKRIWTMHVGDRRWAVGKLLEVLGESNYDRRLARALRFAIWRHDLKQRFKHALPTSLGHRRTSHHARQRRVPRGTRGLHRTFSRRRP